MWLPSPPLPHRDPPQLFSFDKINSLAPIHITDKSDVVVRVLDVNDNAPRFVLDSYQEVISENATVDSEILRVTATDADSGTNGQIHYRIDHGNSNGTFELDDNNGVLKLQQRLTTQASDFYNLTIFAMDHGVPFLISRPTFIYLKVRRSIHPPCTKKLEFPKVIYLADVNESIPIGSNILRVTAKNGRCNPASKVNYFLSEIRDPEIDDHFKVFSQTGVIKLLKPLDFEDRNRYTFYVGATGKSIHVHKAAFSSLFHVHCPDLARRPSLRYKV